MFKLKIFVIICASFLLVFVYGCNQSSKEDKGAEANPQKQEIKESTAQESEQAEHAVEEHGEHTAQEEGHGEHPGEEHKENTGEGEETGPRISKDGTYDEVRKGVRLILSFDSESSSFMGTVENVTEKIVSKVRIEVHLSNGLELGPTEPIDLVPGKKTDIKLSAERQTFTWWKAHAEAGASEH